jgi:repressor LexA
MRKIVFEYIKQYFIEHGYAPSVREIGEGVGLDSSSTVHQHLNSLMKDGYLETDRKFSGAARAYRVRGMKVIFEEPDS